jgi:hypothetical protein
MLSYQSDSCCDVGKRFANTEDRATRQRRSLPELRAAKGASNASKERFRTGRLDENRMRDSDVHSVHGSAGVSFAGTVIFSQEPIFRRVTAARPFPFRESLQFLTKNLVTLFGQIAFILVAPTPWRQRIRGNITGRILTENGPTQIPQ